MGKLEIGDKVWVSTADGAEKRGWAVWDGEKWLAPCGISYWPRFLKDYLRTQSLYRKHCNDVAIEFYGVNWKHMAEQLIATGEM